MLVRRYQQSDLGAVLELHRRQGLNYELPRLDTMVASCIIEEDGAITHALFLRPTAETFWLYAPGGRHRDTLGRLLVLHKEMEPEAALAGLTDIHAFIPPEVDTVKFRRTMLKLGWQRPLWTCYSHTVAQSLVEV